MSGCEIGKTTSHQFNVKLNYEVKTKNIYRISVQHCITDVVQAPNQARIQDLGEGGGGSDFQEQNLLRNLGTKIGNLGTKVQNLGTQIA